MAEAEANPSTLPIPPTDSEPTSSFERWRKSVSMFTGLGLSDDEVIERNELKDQQKLEKDWDTM